jgi:hypothetical protein
MFYYSWDYPATALASYNGIWKHFSGMMTGYGTPVIRTASYFIMSLCCHVIPGTGHATRVPVEQSVPVMVARAVFISLHAGLVGVTLYPPVAAIYPCISMAAHENRRIRPDTGPADAPASIIYMYSRTLPACALT